MYQSTVFCNCWLCSSKILHGTVICDRQVSQLLTCCVPRIDAYNPYPILRLLLVAPLSELTPLSQCWPRVSHLSLPHPLPLLTYTSPREAEARDQEAAARDFTVPAPTRESPCTPYTTGLTAAFAPNAERIVTRLEDDLELQVQQDATDASPLHTVSLADPERVFSVLFGKVHLREGGLV
ncbi:uncharacterized protein SCHCODRAFT_02691127 [Schizophyllum commune H4-8]|nr:uncharacterized protein SCHCODRAFT_02691127 [Schizophyllum commune H4-8]KAI5889351.1 hypothetical protein SCHCODRAFT_02691127 [Schizophyllum commune H4-8]